MNDLCDLYDGQNTSDTRRVFVFQLFMLHGSNAPSARILEKKVCWVVLQHTLTNTLKRFTGKSFINMKTGQVEVMCVCVVSHQGIQFHHIHEQPANVSHTLGVE